MYDNVELNLSIAVASAAFYHCSDGCLSFPSFGFHVRFVLSAAMENGRRFSDNQVDQPRHLGGRGGVWSVQSGVVHIYVKKIIEQYSDHAGVITPSRF